MKVYTKQSYDLVVKEQALHGRRWLDVYQAIILFIMSTGFFGNIPIFGLIPILFLRTHGVRVYFEPLLVILVALLILVPFLGIFTKNEHLDALGALRVVLLPVSLVVLVTLSSCISAAVLQIFFRLILIEVGIAIYLFIAGKFSVFPFVKPPMEDPTLLFSGVFNTWKTAGLSSNSSLLAFKILLIVPFLKMFNVGLSSWMLVILGIIVSGSRAAQFLVFIYIFTSLNNRLRLTMIAILLGIFLTWAGMLKDVLYPIIEFYIRGYENILAFDISSNSVNRFAYWLYGSSHIAENPLLGQGGNPVFVDVEGGNPNRLHSVFLQAAADYGVLVGVLYTVYFCRMLRSAKRALMIYAGWGLVNQGFLAIFGFGDLFFFMLVGYLRQRKKA